MYPFAALLAPSIVVVVVLALAGASIGVLRQYERGVTFTLGRFAGIRGPGLILSIPYIKQIRLVDLRTVVMEVPKQNVVSRDDVSMPLAIVKPFLDILEKRAPATASVNGLKLPALS